MENITDPSFNTDDDVPAAKVPGAAQPMVVVQYRARGVPWWLLPLLAVFAPVCAILIYDSLVVGRYRAQAVETAEALRTKLDGERPVEVKKSPEAALPLALNSQPIVEPAPSGSSPMPSGGAASAGGEEGGSVASASAPAGPATPGAGAASGEALRAQKAAGESAPGSNRSVSPSGALVAAAATRGPAAGPGGVSTRQGAATVAEKAANQPVAAGPKPGVGGDPPNSSATVTAALQFVERNQDRLPALDRSPFDDPSERTDRSNPTRRGEIDPARLASANAEPKAGGTKPVGEPKGAGIPPVLQPLPTEEETLRQIEEEAAQNQARIRDQQAKDAVELRSSRYQERAKFRDELRTILQEHGNLAGPEINQLAKRSSFDKDPERLDQATRICASRGNTHKQPRSK